jgi:DNA-binding LacI/PurR family transcriptional regulator
VGDITIKDVAKAAGVSVATVSRVVNKNYYVSPDLKEKVLDVIHRLGYYPNSVARSLKKEKTNTIGFLVSNISNNYFTSLSKAVEDVIQSRNYNLIVCSTDDRKDREYAYLKLLLEKKVDGLILNTTGENDDFIASLSEKLPVVLISRKIDKKNFKGDLVDSDNINGAYSLTQHLISLGHRKIGIINGLQKVSTGKERFEGFKKAMQEIDINVNNNYKYRYDEDFSLEGGYQGASKLMGSDDRPTAVVIMNNEMILGALKYFRTHDIDIPEVVSVASYGDIINSDLLYVHPSIVTLNPWVIGKKLADLIIERIEQKNDIGNREIRYASQLIPGNGVKII